MPEPPASIEDWYSWIAGIIFTMVSTLVGSIITLARLIENKYKQEIINIKTESAADILELKVEVKGLKDETVKCQEDRYDLAIRLAKVEAIQHTKQDKIHEPT